MLFHYCLCSLCIQLEIFYKYMLTYKIMFLIAMSVYFNCLIVFKIKFFYVYPLIVVIQQIIMIWNAYLFNIVYVKILPLSIKCIGFVDLWKFHCCSGPQLWKHCAFESLFVFGKLHDDDPYQKSSPSQKSCRILPMK